MNFARDGTNTRVSILKRVAKCRRTGYFSSEGASLFHIQLEIFALENRRNGVVRKSISKFSFHSVVGGGVGGGVEKNISYVYLYYELLKKLSTRQFEYKDIF